MQADHPEEILDLVDENDNVIGSKPRGEIYREGLRNIRFVNIFLKNEKGELWIPRRVATKKLFPLYLDMSAAGHVSSGETYDEAFRKEVAEELNIDIDTIPHTLLGHTNSGEHGLYAFSNTYELTSDEVPNYNREDFCEYKWMTPEAILEAESNGEKMKSDLPKLVRLYYT